MGIMHAPESEYAKELLKWNTPKRLGGYGPDGYERFPLMLYKARVKDNGKVVTSEPPPEIHQFTEVNQWNRACLAAEQFTRSCQITVRNEQEYERARSDGWRDTQAQALEHYENLQREIATAAAEANAAALRMSPKAQAERGKREAATDKQVPE